MPPAAPTRIRSGQSSSPISALRRRRSTGSWAGSGRRSVWPPESASTVMSSASGTRAASRACSSSIAPSASRARTIGSGAGRMNSSAISVRDTLAITRFSASTPCRPPARSPASR
ncbi:hypothetical protein SGLAM104S_05460 [Streptomyces glaucescens]